VTGAAGTASFSADLLARAARVRLLLTDVDGCWTDGRITIGADGQESVRFHIHDGFGIVLLRKTDVEIALISGRDTAAVRHRANGLGLTIVHLGVRDKATVTGPLLLARGLAREQIAAFGDDLPDLPLFDCAGLRIAPPGAMPEILGRADYVTRAPGGGGALREVCDLLLAARRT
jgi:3-deoxy-D-manno-octulosonate 8-phosphate phosphatase (KDO 8-P phosphatase)